MRRPLAGFSKRGSELDRKDSRKVTNLAAVTSKVIMQGDLQRVYLDLGLSTMEHHLLLAYRDLDSLCCKALAKIRTLYHTRKLLSRMDLKGLAKAGGEHWRGGSVECLGRSRAADADEIHFQPVMDTTQRIDA